MRRTDKLEKQQFAYRKDYIRAFFVCIACSEDGGEINEYMARLRNEETSIVFRYEYSWI